MCLGGEVFQTEHEDQFCVVYWVSSCVIEKRCLVQQFLRVVYVYHGGVDLCPNATEAGGRTLPGRI